jgi:DNA primase large subunit
LYVDLQHSPKLILPEIDRAAACFPPCMRRLHHTLRTTHHLKHESRFVYQLFLKGAGLAVGETLGLFEREFLQVKTPDVIKKKGYLYSIRHLYGLEGSRIDRKPHTCAQIISKHSGKCPMAQAATLGDELDVVGVPQVVRENFTRGGGAAVTAANAQAACACHYRSAHLQQPGGAPNHGGGAGAGTFPSPNHYFAAALAASNQMARAVATKGGGATE